MVNIDDENNNKESEGKNMISKLKIVASLLDMFNKMKAKTSVSDENGLMKASIPITSLTTATSTSTSSDDFDLDSSMPSEAPTMSSKPILSPEQEEGLQLSATLHIELIFSNLKNNK